MVLTAHDQGQYRTSAPLIAEMTKDERIDSHLDTLVSGVLRLPLDFIGPDDEVRLAFRSAWERAWDEGQAREWLSTAVMAGEALAEVDWDTSDPARWIPTCIRAWPSEFLYVDLATGKRILQTMEGIVEIDPADRSGKWLLLSMGGERPWLRGAVRSLAQPWLARQLARRDWLRSSEVLGMGIRKARVPADAKQEDKDAFFEQVANLTNEPTIQVTKPGDGQGDGWDVELMESAREPGESFSGLLLRTEADIAIRLLGQNASTENSGPYVAASGLFARVTQARINGLVGPLERCIKESLGIPFAVLNFKDGESRAAFIDYDSEPPPDKAAQAQTMATLGTGVTALKTAGFNVSAEELSRRFGFKLEAATVGSTQFFAYDLEQGTVTVNEYRASKGLPPVPWGNQTVPERKAELERLAAPPPAEPAPEPTTPAEPVAP